MKDSKKERYFKKKANINSNINFLFKLFFIFLQINFIKTNNCLISNNTIITSQWLNNIICIGDDDFRYINFAKFENGDMIVETTAIPDLPKRMFYGITKDGEPLFKNGQYHATIEISGQDDTNNGRFEGEIFIVPIDNKDYLVSIPKGKKYIELYDLNNFVKISQKPAIELFEVNQIVSILNYATSYKDGDKTYFIFPFVEKSDIYTNILYLKKLYFSSTDIENHNPVLKTYFLYYVNIKAVSCFTTDSNYIICLFSLFFVDPSNNYYNFYEIGVYSQNLDRIL